MCQTMKKDYSYFKGLTEKEEILGEVVPYVTQGIWSCSSKCFSKSATLLKNNKEPNVKAYYKAQGHETMKNKMINNLFPPYTNCEFDFICAWGKQ